MKRMLLATVFGLVACGADAPPETTQVVAADGSTNAAVAPPPDAITEPSEEQMRQAYVARLDQVNAGGGIEVQMSGASSKPFQMVLRGFRKLGCEPLGDKFRCQAEVHLAFPETKLSDSIETDNDVYRRDAQGQWYLRP